MIQIRPFQKSDRDIVRQICCDVADGGGAIENFFPDREIAADLLTEYYLDYEPESTFVAQVDGKVVAYTTGCLDNRRYGLVVIFLIIPKLILKGLFRGVFFQPQLWQILRAAMLNWRRAFVWRKQSFHSHQGHIHIGISKPFRGKHIGRNLVETLLNYAKDKNIHEIVASVNGHNTAACRFFEHVGFRPQEHYPMLMAYGDSLKAYDAITYVKNIF